MMTEKNARLVASLLEILDELKDLKEELQVKGRDFYMCAQDKDEGLNASMTLPAESGIAFVDEVAKGIRDRLIGLGVTPDPAPGPT